MRARTLLFAACFALALGCGDGVGRPIVEDDAARSSGGGSAGSGGTAGNWRPDDYPGFGGRDARWGGAGGGAGAGSGGGGDGSVPPGEYCEGVADWPPASEYGELSLLEFVNVVRRVGVPCGADETRVSAPPVTMKPELRCAARLHSRDMTERNFFAHVNLDGIDTDERIRRAGYSAFGVAGESIARGESYGGSGVPAPAFEELFSAGGSECETLLDPAFDSVGIGHFGELWTLDFTGP